MTPVHLSRVTCPDWDTLLAFDAGRLSGPAMERVRVHVDACVFCGTILYDSSDDDSPCREGPTTVHGQAMTGPETVAGTPPPTVAGGRSTLPPGDTNTAFDVEVDGRIGPYTILGTLGRGGMGIVFRAVRTPGDRPVALKAVVPGTTDPQGVRARFERERVAVARLDHPNIVRVYDADEARGVLYYAMELVEGETLASRLLRGPLGFRDAGGLVRTLAEAVHYAHERRVVHRDLKPGNVLVAAGETETVKVVDFGLAVLLDDTSDRLTRVDAVVGSPSYMAPEQAGAAFTEIGPWTDVYALGAILYETLTGRPPFSTANKFRTLELVRTTKPVRPRELRAGVPAGLEAICLKCLAKSPGARYRSGEDLAADLGRWLAGERPSARLPGGITRLIRDAVRRVADAARSSGPAAPGCWPESPEPERTQAIDNPDPGEGGNPGDPGSLQPSPAPGR